MAFVLFTKVRLTSPLLRSAKLIATLHQFEDPSVAYYFDLMDATLVMVSAFCLIFSISSRQQPWDAMGSTGDAKEEHTLRSRNRRPGAGTINVDAT